MAKITEIQSILVLFLLGLISFLLLQYIFKKKSNPESTCFRLPPSPPRLPLIGHLHLLTPTVFKSFHKLNSKYGSVLCLRLGSYPLVLVSSPSMAAEFFKTNDLHLAYKPKSPLEDGLPFGNSGLITAPYGDYWRFMNKLCLTELLGPRQLARSQSVRSEELERFLRKLLEKAQENEVIDLRAELIALTNNTTCRMAMSTRCSAEDNEAERCRELVKQSFELPLKLFLAGLFGPLGKLGCWVFGKQGMDAPRKYDELMEKLLKEHEDRAKKAGEEREDKDLMDILLEVYNDKEAEVKISRNNMKAFFLDLFIAGTSTSADTMQWTMAELINHPDVFKKLREEIESVVGRKRLVKESDINNLRYLHAVVKETLRLHPPAPAIWRRCAEKCTLGGFDIPKGTTVVFNIYSTMRDTESWDNPNEFHPERFLVKDENKEMKGQNFSFIPFGAGRRMCPGANLATISINSSVAAMVQCFDWKLRDSDGAEVNMQEKPGFTTTMVHPLLCHTAVYLNPFGSMND